MHPDRHNGGARTIELPQYLTQHACSEFLEILDLIGPSNLRPPLKPIRIPDHPKRRYYRAHSDLFTRSYFMKNFFKALLVKLVIRERLRGLQDFVDLGADAAPLSCAFAYASRVSRITFVDRAKSQLKIGKRYLKAASPSVHINILSEDVLYFGNFVPKTNIFSSYFVDKFIEAGGDFLEVANRSASFLAIDSLRAVESLGHMNIEKRLLFGYVEFDVHEDLAMLVEGGSDKFSFIYGAHDDYKY